MTHTLHRAPPKEDSCEDFVVLAMPASQLEPELAVPRQKEFLRWALDHDPVNLGDSAHGALHASQENLGPAVHWSRRDERSPSRVIEAVDSPSAVAAVFDDQERVVDFLEELQEADLGLSINLSAELGTIEECCRLAGLEPHSSEYSVPVLEECEKLPEHEALRLSMMCGHGMVSFDFAKKMLQWVRTGRRTPEEASRYLARFCGCGAYNVARAADLLAEAVSSGSDDSSGLGGGRE